MDVVVGGEQPPVTFRHQLQSAGSQYKCSIASDSPNQDISFSAKAVATARAETDFKNLSGADFDSLQSGQELTPTELAIFAGKCGKPYTKGVVLGEGYNRTVQLICEKALDELQKEQMRSEQASCSQHSSVVMSEDAPAKATPFDLTVGVCRAFDHRCGEFWTELPLRGDWRMKRNGLSITVDYYNAGKLSKYRTKDFMNGPDDILPKRKFGMVNEYYHSTTVQPTRRNEIYNVETSNLQQDMPKPLNVQGQIMRLGNTVRIIIGAVSLRAITACTKKISSQVIYRYDDSRYLELEGPDCEDTLWYYGTRRNTHKKLADSTYSTYQISSGVYIRSSDKYILIP